MTPAPLATIGALDAPPPRAALSRLGIDRLALSIHHVSFPAGDGDIGHGAPSSPRGRDFLRFVAELGFTHVALGPAGIVTAGNPSPYDGTLFSRNPMAISWAGLVPEDLLRAHALPPAEVAEQAHAEVAAARLAAALPPRDASDWLAARPWIAHDAALEADPATFARVQRVAEEQHDELRGYATRLGLGLYADAQIGVSPRDRRGREALFLRGWLLGAPPSRTNPEGQPWGYPVLDPRQLEPGGAARGFLLGRLEELLARHDGLRIDHPHGLVCPWVYRDGDEPARGARLHESPDVPELAGFARVRVEQLARELPRHHDDWVRWLDPEQIDAYALVLDAVVARAGRDDVMAEVLSTCPRPLAAVLDRHGLGRFRVTQKARVDDAADVYRADSARPADWVMAGNHDTPPLALAVERWQGTPEIARRVRYLAARLRLRDPERLERDPRALADAMLAELFLGPARHVLIFWVDLFEGRALFNRPGEVHEANWRARVPPDFERAYGGALERALALALSARV
jgi:hypothetical protein